MLTLREAEFFVLNKLLQGQYIGHKQMLVDNIPKGTPRSDWKIIRKAIESLHRTGLLFFKPKHYGIHCSIQPSGLPEVYLYISKIKKEFR